MPRKRLFGLEASCLVTFLYSKSYYWLIFPMKGLSVNYLKLFIFKSQVI